MENQDKEQKVKYFVDSYKRQIISNKITVDSKAFELLEVMLSGSNFESFLFNENVELLDIMELSQRIGISRSNAHNLRKVLSCHSLNGDIYNRNGNGNREPTLEKALDVYKKLNIIPTRFGRVRFLGEGSAILLEEYLYQEGHIKSKRYQEYLAKRKKESKSR